MRVQDIRAYFKVRKDVSREQSVLITRQKKKRKKTFAVAIFRQSYGKILLPKQISK